MTHSVPPDTVHDQVTQSARDTQNTAAKTLDDVIRERPYLFRACFPLPQHLQRDRVAAARYLTHGKPLKKLTPKEQRVLLYS